MGPERCIARVLRADGRAAGLAFMVAPGYLLTCAHVVNAALGRALREESEPPAEASVQLVFPFGGSRADSPPQRVAQTAGWLPFGSLFDERDVALLRLCADSPLGGDVLRVSHSTAASAVQMWGPVKDGLTGGHVAGTLMGAVDRSRLQIDQEFQGAFRVGHGFSGGPVWKQSTGEVVGILQAATIGDGATDAYVLDVELGADLLPADTAFKRGPLPGSSFRTRIATLSQADWVRSKTVLWLAAAVVIVSMLSTTTSIIAASRLLGVAYYVIRVGLLLWGIRLVVDERKPAVGLGLVVGTTGWLIADAVQSASSGRGVGWLEFFAVSAFSGLLALRLWPFPAVPRKLHVVPPTRRPFAWAVLIAAAAQFILLFVPIRFSTQTYTIADFGILGGLLAVLPIGALCSYVAVSEAGDRAQRVFVAAATAVFLSPELFLLLAPLTLGSSFTYLGDGAWITEVDAAWFVVLQACAAGALMASTLLLLRSLPATRMSHVRTTSPE